MWLQRSLSVRVWRIFNNKKQGEFTLLFIFVSAVSIHNPHQEPQSTLPSLSRIGKWQWLCHRRSASAMLRVGNLWWLPCLVGIGRWSRTRGHVYEASGWRHYTLGHRVDFRESRGYRRRALFGVRYILDGQSTCQRRLVLHGLHSRSRVRFDSRRNDIRCTSR